MPGQRRLPRPHSQPPVAGDPLSSLARSLILGYLMCNRAFRCLGRRKVRADVMQAVPLTANRQNPGRARKNS